MFFENETFSAHVLTIDRFSHDTPTVHVNARPFSALALRLQGDARFHFSDGTELTSRCGDVLYLPHGLSYEASYTNMEVLAIHFRDNSAGNTAENHTPAAGTVACFFQEAHTLWQINTSAARIKATALLYRIIAELAELPCDGVEQTALNRAVAILTEEFADPNLNFPTVCERSGISESTFRRNFRTRYGKPPVKYLTELRIFAAQKQLVSTRATVEQIALNCGFHDVKYFSRVFKKHFGCTPSELRTL